MNNLSNYIDPIWEKKYSNGHIEKYPWDVVVSFIFNYKPKGKSANEVKILEVGYGTGANLWFAAREGFNVSGIEQSKSAVKYAKERFKRHGLKGDLQIGDFRQLPFTSNSFDLIIDRASLCCVGFESQKKSLHEVYRCLKDGGVFLHNTYSNEHTSMSNGEKGSDRVIKNIKSGTLVDAGQIYFSSINDIKNVFSEGWKLRELQKREWHDMINSDTDLHSEWIAIAEK